MGSDQQLSRDPLSDQHDTRLQRIADYLAGSLAKPDKLESVLGSASAGLMGIALQIEAAVAELLSQPEAAGADISRAVGAIDTHLRVARQIERLAQLELRIGDRSRNRGKLLGLASEPLAPMGTPGEFLKN